MGDVGRMWCVMYVLALAGCLAPSSQVCPGGGVCPSGLRCLEFEEEQVCILPTCGNGRLEAGEDCDDGNNLLGDSCRFDCQMPPPVLTCGNGIIDSLEVCDDGNVSSGDGCSAECTSDERCGNGIVDEPEACDDADLRSHDGCASTCAKEQLTWHLFEDVPKKRVGHAMVYDASRGKVVLFGGCARREVGDCNGGFRNDTWEWDGNGWVDRTPSHVPPARGSHAMAYDAARRKVVLFGGCAGWEPSSPNWPRCLAPLNDTWEWDGASWVKLIPMTSPAARGAHAMAYDATHAKVVLFGGQVEGVSSENVLKDDTWFWDGTNWERIEEFAPRPRIQHAMAYDSMRGRVVLFGGRNATELFDDTWEFNGGMFPQWRKRVPTIRPTARSSHAMAFAHGKVVLIGGCTSSMQPTLDWWGCAGPGQSSMELWEWDGSQWTNRPATTQLSNRWMQGLAYDAARSQLLLFGGEDGTAFSEETWEWDGASWIQRTPATIPVFSRTTYLAYDAARAKVVLFGGGMYSNGSMSNDTWEWDGTWIQRVTAIAPPARDEGAITYDAARRRVVLFGGYIEGSPINDTWEWDGSKWIQRNPSTRPQPRFGHLLTYDVSRGKVVLFGGGYLNDTWEWDGTNWAIKPVGPAPPARQYSSMAYDVARQKIVLFGGQNFNQHRLDDTWEWDGSSWIKLDPASSPSHRDGHALTYDPIRQRVMMFGGETHAAALLDDTWEWDGVTWTAVSTAPRPQARHGHAMVYDTARSHMLMFGARFPSPPVWKTWLARFEAPGVAESCVLGLDADRDGKIGCNDPDCAGLCDPLCASFGVCTGARPYCGDGVCSTLEGCRACPADCGSCPVVCGDSHCDAGESCSTCASDCPCP